MNQNNCEGILQGMIKASTQNGGINVNKGSGDDYVVEVQLYADGDSPEEAEEHLRMIQVEFTENGYMDYDGDLVGVGIDENIEFPNAPDYSQGGSISITLPEAIYDLSLDTANGGIECSGLELNGASLKTANGGIDVNSPVWYPGEYNFNTANGGIAVSLDGFGNGEARVILNTANGGIDVNVPGDNRYGYEVDASTSNGNVEIDLPNVDYIINEDEHKQVRTKGYSDKSARLHCDFETSNGGIEVKT